MVIGRIIVIACFFLKNAKALEIGVVRVSLFSLPSRRLSLRGGLTRKVGRRSGTWQGHNSVRERITSTFRHADYAETSPWVRKKTRSFAALRMTDMISRYGNDYFSPILNPILNPCRHPFAR